MHLQNGYTTQLSNNISKENCEKHFKLCPFKGITTLSAKRRIKRQWQRQCHQRKFMVTLHLTFQIDPFPSVTIRTMYPI